MKLVKGHRDRHGLNRCLEAIGLAKSTWYDRLRRPDPGAKDRALLEVLLEVIEEYPEYGYRRLLPEVNERMEDTVNHKRLRRVLKEHELALKRSVPKHKPSPVRKILKQARGHLDLVTDSEAPGPLEVLSTDFTELKYADGSRKAYLMAFVDVAGKLVPGWTLSRRADRQLALRAWKQAKETLSLLGRSAAGLMVHSDQDAVYTSYDWLDRLLVRDGARASYSERGCKDNPWIESLWSRMKDEIGSRINQAETLGELRQILKERFTKYNTRRRHSLIEYQSPINYLRTRGEDIEPVLAALSD
ncbi:MAG: IS3 family transposase [Rhodothermales bacterium]